MAIDAPPAVPSHAAVIIIWQHTSAASAAGAAIWARDGRGVILASSAPARPGYMAEREELDAALQAGTIERLRLFLDRHPQSRYRAEAEKALRRQQAARSR
jgi:hypothetical protein